MRSDNMEICISEYNEKKIVVLLDNEMKIVSLLTQLLICFCRIYALLSHLQQKDHFRINLKKDV